MIDIFEDRLGIDAGCPGDIPVSATTQIKGSVDYHLVNAGDEDGAISILIVLSDSAGHQEQFSSSLEVIPAKGDLTDSHVLFLNATYDTPGQINVTIQVQFSGSLNDTKFAECSFFVLSS
jgi:hypothetical protein